MLGSKWIAMLLAVLVLAAPVAAAAPVSSFKATQAGRQTLDLGDSGGNPFAAALIRILEDKEASLADLPLQLTELTEYLSRGYQIPDVKSGKAPADLRLAAPAAGERRVALVLVYSNYEKAQPLPSLEGARNDSERLRKALVAAGFETIVALDPPRAEVDAILSGFAGRSASADLALLYTTGHGVEVDDIGYLLPGDYPADRGAASLTSRAIKLDTIAASMKASAANLFFYGGCRDNPFVAAH